MHDEQTSFVKLRFFGIPKLLPYLRPYRRMIVFMVLCGLFSSLVDAIVPLFQQYAINHYVGENTMDTILVFVILYLAVIGTQAFANFTSTYFASHVELSVARDMRRAGFHHLQTLSFSYFNQNSVGYIHSRLMSDTSRIGELVAWTLMDAVWHGSYLVFVTIVMFSIQPFLAALVMLIVPVTVILIALFQRRLTGYNRKVREINSQMTGHFNEGITGARTVKSLVAEKPMRKTFCETTARMRVFAVRAAKCNALFASTVTFASSLAVALVLWRGGIITADGVMLIGTLSVFMSYAMGLMEPIRWMIDGISNLINAQVNIERLTRLIETVPDVADTQEVLDRYGDCFTPKKENWEPLVGDIRFDDVSFRYPDGGEEILSHFNLDIPSGTHVAIVGETGAGKSTLVNLVCRFFEPTSGRVLIDGKDVRERSQLWLHSHLGYVLQTPHLFSGTVLENLRYGKPDATEEEAWAALARVSADEIVRKMDKGLYAEVGEGGDMLSLGERQLISFARALLADPRILVLDEATASVDTLTEQKIKAAINEIIAGRTAIMIAHRLSTVRDADIILVVQDGKISERGTHAELMQAKGKYYSLYTRQSSEERTSAVFGEKTPNQKVR